MKTVEENLRLTKYSMETYLTYLCQILYPEYDVYGATETCHPETNLRTITVHYFGEWIDEDGGYAERHQFDVSGDDIHVKSWNLIANRQANLKGENKQ